MADPTALRTVAEGLHALGYTHYAKAVRDAAEELDRWQVSDYLTDKAIDAARDTVQAELDRRDNELRLLRELLTSVVSAYITGEPFPDIPNEFIPHATH